ncbi:GNAT family N-acetyltransferase [Paenibacillus sp. JDR-2]|uniref:GNAT family N-acetyltransferase n=1 Tax=Paenibacillus sp. (strain JDR-2) TaxID=324057 RepID=UPI000166AF51|nr:GNAT family N-acetyltransferase [Paenibacillus sp. JDR-2]ACS99329.1 GCN5-related N-acetyltransferase [Paenibacillus sp. JDR-2]
MLIRQLQQYDQDRVISIFQEYPLQFPSFVIARYPVRWADYFASSSRSRSDYFVAEDNGEVIGHSGYIFNDDDGLYEIVGVVVKQSAGRKGVGRALLGGICDRLRELGEEQAILYTLGHPGSQGTIDFYKSIGFDLVNEEKDFFAEGYDRVTFTKKFI